MNIQSKAKLIVILALILITTLVFTASFDVEKNIRHEIVGFTELRIYLEKEDATFQITYEAIPIIDLFFFTFGTNHMDGHIDRFMYDFEEYEIKNINKQSAEVKVKNMSVEDEKYYLHYSKKLGAHVDKIIYVYPDGSERVTRNMKKTLNTYYDKENYDNEIEK